MKDANNIVIVSDTGYEWETIKYVLVPPQRADGRGPNLDRLKREFVCLPPREKGLKKERADRFAAWLVKAKGFQSLPFSEAGFMVE